NHDPRSSGMDTIRLELETHSGVTLVECAVMLGQPRLVQVDGIYCEATLAGYLIFMKNDDVPGVIGHAGTVLGANDVNIANFHLGRPDFVPAGKSREAIAVVETDAEVSDDVLAQLRQNKAVKVARVV